MSGLSSTTSYEPRANDIACENLVFNTQLASPKEDVIDLFNVGDVLEVQLHHLNGQVVVYALWQGQIAGGIASGFLPRLRACLVGGTAYIATVMLKQGGQVQVRVCPELAQ